MTDTISPGRLADSFHIKSPARSEPMNSKTHKMNRLTSAAIIMMSVFCWGAITANAATIIDENFDASGSAPAGWVLSGSAISISTDPTFAASPSNSLNVSNLTGPTATTPELGLVGATTATLSFDWTTDVHTSAFGRTTFIDYSSDGTSFTYIGTSIPIPATTGSVPSHTSFTVTINSPTYSFTTNSKFRIRGDTSGGGTHAPIYVDDLLITSNPVPEPATFVLAAIGMLGLVGTRRRRRRER